MTMTESALFAQLRDSPAHLLDLLAHKYIIVDKNEIKGLSGYFCPYCFAFELRHIRDLGYDKVASELHICAPEKKAEASMSFDANNTKIGVYNEAVNCLLSLTRNLFHEPRLVVEKYDEIESREISWASSHTQSIRKEPLGLGTFVLRRASFG